MYSFGGCFTVGRTTVSFEYLRTSNLPCFIKKNVFSSEKITFFQSCPWWFLIHERRVSLCFSVRSGFFMTGSIFKPALASLLRTVLGPIRSFLILRRSPAILFEDLVLFKWAHFTIQWSISFEEFLGLPDLFLSSHVSRFFHLRTVFRETWYFLAIDDIQAPGWFAFLARDYLFCWGSLISSLSIKNLIKKTTHSIQFNFLFYCALQCDSSKNNNIYYLSLFIIDKKNPY